MTRTILAIDDEPLNLRFIDAVLKGSGFEILHAEDGEEGWAILQERHSDIELVLADRMMPKLNGLELAKRIKAHAELAHIPVVMQTASAQKNEVEEGMESGVFHYLTKPYDPGELLAVVQAAIAGTKE